MNELVKWLDAFWIAVAPWTPGLMLVGFLCWWVTLITSFRQRIGRDPGAAPGRHLGAAVQAPPPPPAAPRAPIQPAGKNPVRPGNR